MRHQEKRGDTDKDCDLSLMGANYLLGVEVGRTLGECAMSLPTHGGQKIAAALTFHAVDDIQNDLREATLKLAALSRALFPNGTQAADDELRSMGYAVDGIIRGLLASVNDSLTGAMAKESGGAR